MPDRYRSVRGRYRPCCGGRCLLARPRSGDDASGESQDDENVADTDAAARVAAAARAASAEARKKKRALARFVNAALFNSMAGWAAVVAEFQHH